MMIKTEPGLKDNSATAGRIAGRGLGVCGVAQRKGSQLHSAGSQGTERSIFASPGSRIVSRDSDAERRPIAKPRER